MQGHLPSIDPIGGATQSTPWLPGTSASGPEGGRRPAGGQRSLVDELMPRWVRRDPGGRLLQVTDHHRPEPAAGGGRSAAAFRRLRRTCSATGVQIRAAPRGGRWVPSPCRRRWPRARARVHRALVGPRLRPRRLERRGVHRVRPARVCVGDLGLHGPALRRELLHPRHRRPSAMHRRRRPTEIQPVLDPRRTVRRSHGPPRPPTRS